MDFASYDADYKDDNKMRELDTALDACAKKVEVGSGLDRLKQFVSYLRTSSDETAKKINSCQKEILDAKAGGKRTAKVMLLDTVLIQEYLDNSSKTHDLCINELQDFINSASKMASCIEEKKSDQRVQQIQMKVEENAEKVVKKINTLLNQHVATLHKLNTTIKKQQRASIFRKVLNVIFIGSLSAAFVCSVIMATAMAVPAATAYLAAHQVLKTIIAAGAVVQTLSPAIKTVRTSLDKMIKDHEPNYLKAQKGLNQSMQAGTLEIIKELKNIRCQVKTVNEMGKGVSQGPLEKLKEFNVEIEKLKKAIENCASVIETARTEVVAKYEELKTQIQQ